MSELVLEQCFKPRIKKEKFQEWLNCYDVKEEHEIISEMKDLQKRGYDISNVIELVDNFN